jgi:Domain of unknown function (DUF4281)
MTAEQLFSVLNMTTVAAWLPLVFLPRARWASTVVPVVMPALLAVIYVVLVAATLVRSEGGFSTLAGVRTLFDNPWALLAGWAHYLAFDLFVGGWEVRDAQRRGVPHLLVAPSSRAVCGHWSRVAHLPSDAAALGRPCSAREPPRERCARSGCLCRGANARADTRRAQRGALPGAGRYSTRSVLAGSTSAARRAGTHVAADATASSTGAITSPIR